MGASASATAPVSPRRGAAVVVVGGSQAQRQLARLTALRVGGLTIRRVVFRQPDKTLRRQHVGGLELVVSSGGVKTLRSIWEQELYVGTYLGLMARRPGSAVAAAVSDQTEGPVSRLRPYDVFGSNPTSTEVLQREVLPLSHAAQRLGARIVELGVAATPARVIALTLRVADPAAFLKHSTVPLLRLLEKPGITLLGYYLGIQDDSGRLVWATSQLPNTGGVYSIPSLEACSPVSHGGMGGLGLSQPLPCPAR
jgi:hypothetical protein